jgi:hypothetical protein
VAKTIFIPSNSAAVVNGYLIPGHDFIKALVDQLRADIAKDPALWQRFQQDPRSVLGERGIVRDLQNEILVEQGIPVEQDAGDWCLSSGSCCCATMHVEEELPT